MSEMDVSALVESLGRLLDARIKADSARRKRDNFGSRDYPFEDDELVAKASEAACEADEAERQFGELLAEFVDARVEAALKARGS